MRRKNMKGHLTPTLKLHDVLIVGRRAFKEMKLKN